MKTIFRLAPLAPFILLVAAGCTQPTIEGGQILKPPPGFAYDPNCSAAGLVYGHDELVGQRCWFTRQEPHCAITVSEFKGGCNGADVQAAREAYVAKNKYLEFGPLETLHIDGQPAWGWLETQKSNGAVYSLKYSAVVCYRASRYLVDYFAADPKFRDEAGQRKMVASFRVIKSGDVDPAKVVVGALLAVAVYFVYRRFRAA